jgi:ribosomal protein S18 acetylase RimI-like enzyme
MLTVRKAEKRDRAALYRLIRATDVFNREEKAVARELVAAALGKRRGEHPDYKLLVAGREPGPLLGYACYGPSPMTVGTWDVYWVIVGPAARRRGVGRALLEALLRAVRARGGKRLIIDTSSQASYRPARALYESAGLRPLCTVPDYYKKGWHRITFFKKL